MDNAYKAADTQIRTDFAAADTTLQNNIDAKVAQTAYDTKMSALDNADNALSGRATALETKTAKFNTAGDNLTGMANITSTAATLGGVGFASAGVMTGVSSIDGIAIDASRNPVSYTHLDVYKRQVQQCIERTDTNMSRA